MNKIFRVIWSQAQQAWVVVSELTKSHGKGHSSVNEQAVDSEAKSVKTGFALTAVAACVWFVTNQAFAVTYSGSTANNNNFRDHNTTIILGNGASTYTTTLPVEGNRNINPDAVIIGANAGNSNIRGNGAKVTIVGANAHAGDSSTAVGWSSSANTTFAVAVGYEAVAAGGSSVAVGRNSRGGAEAAAVGPNATANAFGVGIGLASKAWANGAVAIGRNSQVGVSKDMAEDNLNGIYGVAIGQNAVVTGTSGVAIGQDAKANRDNFGNAFGANSQALGRSSFAVGHTAIANGTTSIAMLFNSNADKEHDVAIGHEAKASGGASLALMHGSKATADGATAVGRKSEASAVGASAFGPDAKAQKDWAVAIGSGATAGTARSVALGDGATTAAAVGTTRATVNGITYGDFAGTSPVGTVSVGGNGLRTITNVAAGRINETSTDAINGSQLYMVADKLKTYVDSRPSGGTASGNLKFQDGGSGTITKNLGETLRIKGTGGGAEADYSGDNLQTFVNNSEMVVKMKNAPTFSGTITANGGITMGQNQPINMSGGRITNLGAPTANTDAANKAYVDALKLNVGASSTGAGTNVELSRGTPRVDIVGKDNITTSVSGRQILVTLNKNVDLTKDGTINFGDAANTQLNKNGLTVGSGNNVVSVTNNGISAGNKQITNVANGAVNANSKEAVNGSQLFGTNQNVTNLTNTVNKGWTLTHSQGTGGAASGDVNQKVAMGDTVTMEAAKNINIVQAGKKISIATKDDVSFNSVTIGSGTNTTKLTSTANGLDVGGDRITNVANGTAASDAVNLSQLNATKTSVTVGHEWSNANGPAAAKAPLNVTTVQNKDGSVTYRVDAVTTKFEHHTSGKVKDGADMINSEHRLANASMIADAINKSGFNVIGAGNKAAATDTFANELINPGDTVTLEAGKNLTVKQTNGQFTFATANDVSFNSVTIGSGNNITTLTSTPNGLDVGGDRITNIGAPQNDNDATTKKYVDDGRTIVESTDGTVKVTPTTRGGAKVFNLSVTNTGNTAAPVVNAEFDVGAKVGATEKVTLNNGNKRVDIVGSNGITTAVSGNTITVKADTGTMANQNGKLTQNGAGNNALATVSNVVDVVNKSGFNVIGAGNKAATTDTFANELINPGDTVTLEAGKNLTVKQANGQFTFATQNNVQFDRVQLGDNSGPTLSSDGSNIKVAQADGNPTQITNVANGTNANDAVNVSQLNAAKNTVSGAQLATKADETAADKPNAPISVTTSQNTNGSTNFNVNVVTTPLVVNDKGALEQPAASGNRLVTASSIAEAINKSGWNVNTGTTGSGAHLNTAASTLVNPSQEVKFIAGDNLQVGQNGREVTFALNPVLTAISSITMAPSGTINMNGGRVTNLGAPQDAADATTKKYVDDGRTIVRSPDASISVTRKTEGGANVYELKALNTNGGTTTITGMNQFTVGSSATDSGITVNQDAPRFNVVGTGSVASSTDGRDIRVDLTETTKNDIKQGVDANTTVSTKGLTFAAEEGKTDEQKLGSTVDVVGDDNIDTKASSNRLTIGLKPNVNLTENGSIQFGNNNAVLNKNGLTTGPVSVTNTGINAGNLNIDGVKEGEISETSKQAVNGSQLFATNNNVTNLAAEVAKGWNITHAQGQGGEASGDTNQKVAMGETVTIEAAKNIKVVQSARQLAISTVENPAFTSVVIGNGDTTTLTSTANGLDVGGDRITNIGAPVAENDATTKKYVDDGRTIVRSPDGSVSVTKKTEGDANVYELKVTNTGGATTVVNADFEVGAGDAGKVDLNAGNKRVDIVGSNGITTAVDGNKITVQAATTNLTTDADGKAKTATDGDTTSLVTGAQVAQAINKAGLKFKGDKGEGAQNEFTRLNQETTSVLGGAEGDLSEKNIAVISNGADTLTVKLAKTLTDLTSAEFKDAAGNTTTVGGNGITITPTNKANNPVTLSGTGLNNGNNQITNVASGGDVGTNAANIDDVKQLASKVASANANQVSVTPTENGDGSKTYTVGVVTGAPSVTNNGALTAPTNGDALVTASSLTDAVNQSGFNVIGDGNREDGSAAFANELINPGETVTLAAGKNLTVAQDKGKFTFATANDVSFNSVTIGSGTNTTKLTSTADGLDVGGDRITNIGTPVADNDATTKKYVDDGRTIVESSDQSVSVKESERNGAKVFDVKVTPAASAAFEVGAGNAGKVDLNAGNKRVDIVGSNGITTAVDGNKITVQAATTNLTTDDADGKAKTQTDGDTTSLVTGDQVAQAVNKAGLKFKGDKGEGAQNEFTRLNQETTSVLGGAEGDLSEKNIAVISNGADTLTVKLAKTLTDLTSAEFKDDKENTTTISGNGLTITPKDGTNGTSGKNGTIVSLTNEGLNNGGNQIVNVASGLNGTKLSEATGDTLTNAVNVSDLKEAASNITNAANGGGFILKDANGIEVKQDLGKAIELKGKDGVTVTAKPDDKALEVSLSGDTKVVAKDGKDGSLTVQGKDGKDGISIQPSAIVFNGVDGVNGKDGADGKDGQASLTLAKGAKGLDGNDGQAGANGVDGKTRIVYEKPNGDKEEVATLNDGLIFTGNNVDTLNRHKLNTVVNIVGEGIDKVASAAFKSAAGNINVKANGTDTLEIQLNRELKDLSAANFVNYTTVDGQEKVDSEAPKTSLTHTGLTITPKDGTNGTSGKNGTIVSLTNEGLNNGGNQIVNVASGLNGTKLSEATGDTLTNAVNVSDLKEAASNITNAANGGGFILKDANGIEVKQDLGKAIELKGKDGVTVTAKPNETALEVSLSGDTKVVAKDGKDGSLTVQGKDGKDGISIQPSAIVFNGVDGVNGKDGADGKDGQASLTLAKGAKGLDGNDGKDGANGVDGKTRIVYEKPNGDKEEVATLNDGLIFTGNNADTLNSHKLNTVVNIVGEGIDKVASAAFKSAAGNINVKADGTDTLEIQLNRELKDLSAANFVNYTTVDGQEKVDSEAPKTSLTHTGLTITPKDGTNGTSGKNGTIVSLTNEGLNNGGNQIVNVASGLGNTKLSEATGDTLTNAVNVSDLKEAASNITNAANGGGFILKDANGIEVKQDLGKAIELKGKDGVTVTAKPNETALEVSLSGDTKVVAKDGKDGSLTVQGKDGKDGISIQPSAIVFNGVDGVNGKDGADGKDGQASLTLAKGAKGLDGNDGKDGANGVDGKTRIVYEKPNGDKEEVATLNDGLIFTGNNADTLNTHKLNTVVNIVGEGIDKVASAAFKSAAGNINVKADGTDTLEIQLNRELKDLSAANFVNYTTVDGQEKVDSEAPKTSLTNTGLTITPKDGTTGTTGQNGNIVSLTNTGLNNGGNQIVNVASGLGNTKLSEATGDTLTNAVNVSDLKEAASNITNAANGGGFILKDANGIEVKQDLGKAIELKGKDGVTVTAKPNETALEVSLSGDTKVVAKDGKDGSLTVQGKDGKDGISIQPSAIVFNGVDGVNGKDGADGKDGQASLTLAKGAKGLDGNDGKDGANGVDGKTRIVYEKPNGDKEEVATLNDGLIFTGNNADTLNTHKLNTVVNIVGEGIDKVASAAFKSAAGNINVKADGTDTLEIQLNRELKDLSAANFVNYTTVDGQEKVDSEAPKTSLTHTGLTITPKDGTNGTSGKNGTIVSLTNEGLNNGGNQIVNVASGLGNTKLSEATGDTLTNAVNVSDLKEAASNITNAANGGGFILKDDQGVEVKQDLGKAIELKGKDGVTVTAKPNETALEVSLSGDTKVVAKDGKDGSLTVQGKDGKDGISIQPSAIVFNGVDGVNGKDGADGKDGQASLTLAKGAKGLDGNDGKDGANGVDGKTRIVYEKPNGDKEEVATLNDGLIFTGNNADTLNTHKLNTVVNIVGEGIDKVASAAFKSAAGNINVKADGTDTLEIQLNRELKDLSAANFVNYTTVDGQEKVDSEAPKTSLTHTGLTITPKDGTNGTSGKNGTIVSLTNEGLNNGGNQIVNVASGLGNTKLSEATGDTLTNAVNVSDLKEAASNITNAANGGGFILKDANGIEVKQDLGKAIELKGKDGVTVTAKPNETALEVSLSGDTKVVAKDGKDGSLTVQGKDGKDGISIQPSAIVFNGVDGVNGKDGADGKDGQASLTLAKGAKGLDGNDGQAGANGVDGKTRIVYEKPNGDKEEVATLNDGLIFTGNNADTLNSHKLNTVVNIVGEGIDKVASAAFKSAAGNINVKADGADTLEIQLNRELKDLSAANFVNYTTVDGQEKVDSEAPKTSLTHTGLTITPKDGTNGTSGKNGTIVSLTNEGLNNGGNQIVNVASGLNGTKLSEATGDTLTNAVNVSDLKEAASNITNAANGGGFILKDANGIEVKQDLGKAIELKGKDGVTVTAKPNETALEVSLSGDTKVVAKDGKDGSLTVQGKDGKDGISIQPSAIVFNGVDGVNGKDGADGKDGQASLTLAKGAKGLDGNDGQAGANGVDGKTRIVYEKPNGDKEEVATLNDGLRFQGDVGEVIEKKLNDTLHIKGNLGAAASVTDKNLRVDNVAGSLILKMARDLTDLTSSTFGDLNSTDNTVVNKDGVTIRNGEDPSRTVKLGDTGLNNGNNQITNVASGLGNTALSEATGDMLKNAVNVGDLQNAAANITNAANGGGFGLSDQHGNTLSQNLGTAISVKGDGNIETKVVTQDGTPHLEVQLNKNLTEMTSAQFESKDQDGKVTTVTKVTGEGIAISKPNDPNVGHVVSLTHDGLNNGGNKITNVAEGTDPTDGVNVSQLKNATSNAIAGATWQLTTEGDNSTHAVSNQTVNVKHGRNTKVSAVKERTDAQGITHYEYEIDVTGLPMEYVDNDGNSLVNVGGNFYRQEQGANGQLILTPATPAKVKISSQTPMQLSNVDKGTADTDAVNVSQLKPVAENIGGSIDASGQFVAPNYQMTNPSNGATANVNSVKGAIETLDQHVNKPLTFTADSGKHDAKLGTAFGIRGDDKNITTEINEGNVRIKLNENVKLNSAQFGGNSGNRTQVDGNGVQISNDEGDNVSLTINGLDNGGKRISNVAAGQRPSDAVNVSQLRGVANNMVQQINKVDRHARAGIASAGALANLPQVYLPGKSAVSVGSTYYRGEAAYAMGYSRISDNGKWLIKATGSTNTQREVMVGAGASYVW